MKNIAKYLTALGSASLISTAVLAHDHSSCCDERKWYVGGNAGFSSALKSSFKDPGTKSAFTIKKTPMYTGTIGYKVTPDIMVEFTAEYKPKYKLGITLAEVDGGDKEKTKATNKIYMLNLVYNLEEIKGFQPYFSAGAGLAQIKVKEVGITTDAGPFGTIDKFRSLRHTANCFAWEVGFGVSKAITESLSINLAAKMQIAHDVKIKYRSFDLAKSTAKAATGDLNPVYNSGSIKKTLGVGEITVGFTYDLPF